MENLKAFFIKLIDFIKELLENKKPPILIKANSVQQVAPQSNLKKQVEVSLPKPTIIEKVKTISKTAVLKTPIIKKLIKPQGLLWVPFAKRVLSRSYVGRTQGYYRKGYPEGAVIHYTAGSSMKGSVDAYNTLQNGAKAGFSYMIIDRNGVLYQTVPLNRWGYHCGESFVHGLGDFVHQYLVGIELCNSGLIEKLGDKFHTWFGTTISGEEVRYVPKQDENIEPGYYHRYTAAQLATLERTLLWLHENNPKVFKLDLIKGHDEVSPKRKQDPGGALPTNMKQFRQRLMNAANK